MGRRIRFTGARLSASGNRKGHDTDRASGTRRGPELWLGLVGEGELDLFF